MPATWALLAATAMAGVRPFREPLPARAVERGIVNPEGWTEVLAEGSVAGVDSGIRYGLGRGWDIGLAQAWRSDGLDEIGLETRFSLLRREPPLTSVAVELRWDAPVVGIESPAAAGNLAVRQGFGPFQAEIRGGWRQPVDAPGDPLAEAILRMQAGPLVFSGGASSAGAWPPEADLGAQLQLTRALSLGGGAKLPATGPALATVGGSLWW